MKRFILGGISGFLATFPMTVAMVVLHRKLPVSERYPLPPQMITDKLIVEAGAEKRLNEDSEKFLTHLGHFLYGASSGVAYSKFASHTRLSWVSGGLIFGLIIWAGSYLGWLPAFRVLKPATEHPLRRTALMVFAHEVWGLITSSLLFEFDRELRSQYAK